MQIAKRKFRCAFCCAYRPKGFAFRYVDEEISCEICNRVYDFVPKKKIFVCPLCKGVGHFE